MIFLLSSVELAYFVRLQTGMRHAFGKPTGVVARCNIGQIIFSIRTKENVKEQAVESLRRSAFKFAGRQKVSVRSYFIFILLGRRFHLLGIHQVQEGRVPEAFERQQDYSRWC